MDVKIDKSSEVKSHDISVLITTQKRLYFYHIRNNIVKWNRLKMKDTQNSLVLQC